MIAMEDLKDAKFGEGLELPPLATEPALDLEVKLGGICAMLDSTRALLETVLVTADPATLHDRIRLVLANTSPLALYEE